MLLSEAWLILEAIQQLLGHQKAETTAIYARLSGERRREFYKRYNFQKGVFCLDKKIIYLNERLNLIGWRWHWIYEDG